MPRPLLYLDFDGVILPWFRGPSARSVATLNALLAATQAEIVVSSNRRKGRTIQTLASMLKAWGVHGKVIDKTPELPGPIHSVRALEIQAHMDRYPNRPVIVIDDFNVCSLQRNSVRVIRTSAWRGLRQSDVVPMKKAQRKALLLGGLIALGGVTAVWAFTGKPVPFTAEWRKAR